MSIAPSPAQCLLSITFQAATGRLAFPQGNCIALIQNNLPAGNLAPGHNEQENSTLYSFPAHYSRFARELWQYSALWRYSSS